MILNPCNKCLVKSMCSKNMHECEYAEKHYNTWIGIRKWNSLIFTFVSIMPAIVKVKFESVSNLAAAWAWFVLFVLYLIIVYKSNKIIEDHSNRSSYIKLRPVRIKPMKPQPPLRKSY